MKENNIKEAMERLNKSIEKASVNLEKIKDVDEFINDLKE